MRLVMACESRLCSDHVRPFREPFTPPLIILRNGMELRQMESNRPNVISPTLFVNVCRHAKIIRYLPSVHNTIGMPKNSQKRR